MSIKQANYKTVNEASLPIREFNLDQMCNNPQINIIAKRGSGKTTLVSNLLKHFESKNVIPGTIISPTDRMNPFYKTKFDNYKIKYKYDHDIIRDILHDQKDLINNKEHAKSSLVLDDCLDGKGSWMKDGETMEALFNGRYYKLSTIVTMQYLLGISPELRSNFDYIFILAEDFTSNIKKIYEHYAGMFPDFDSFRQVFKELTKDYSAMVLVNRGSQVDILDKVFWFKAEIIPDKKSNDYNKSNDYKEILTENIKIDETADVSELMLKNQFLMSQLLDNQTKLIRILNKQ